MSGLVEDQAAGEDLITSDPEPGYIDTALGRLSITREGSPDKPPLLCVHGIPGSHRDFRYLAPLLVEAFHVVRLEMPGFGRSPLGATPSVRGWTEVIFAVMDRVAPGPFVVVAHSFGGGAVVEAAAERPDKVRGVGLLACPGGRRHRGYAASPRVFRLMAAAVRFPLTRPIICRHAQREYAKIGLRAPDLEHWPLLANQLRVVSTLDFVRIGQRARQIACPVLLAHCEDDRVVQAAIARELAATIPDCTTAFFPEGGHHIQKTRASEVAQLLCDLFAI